MARTTSILTAVAALLPLSFTGCLSQGQVESLACAQNSELCSTLSAVTTGPEYSSRTTLAGVTSYHLRGATSAPYPYIEYLPGGYNENPGKDWPLILMLHGAGEQGQGATVSDLQRAGAHGPNRRTREGRHFPAVILTPMTPSWWSNSGIQDFIDYAEANYRIDRRRIYVTGLSMGGGGTWGLSGLDYNRIAAIAPICGAAGANSTTAQNLLNAGVSVWAFHNQNDGTVTIGNSDGWFNAFGSRLGVPGSVRAANMSGSPTKTAHVNSNNQWEWRDGVNHLNARGASYPRELHYTVYPTGGHDAWTTTYRNDDFWDWLFRQEKR